MTGGTGGGMDAMDYYNGSWSCMVGDVGQKPQAGTAMVTTTDGLQRQIITIPPTGKMKMAYVANAVFSWDPKKHVYVETWNGNDAGASISTAKPWTGNTEQWTDLYNSGGKLTHTKVVRTSHDRFDFESYPTLMSWKAVFKGYCTRSASSS